MIADAFAYALDEIERGISQQSEQASAVAEAQAKADRILAARLAGVA